MSQQLRAAKAEWQTNPLQTTEPKEIGPERNETLALATDAKPVPPFDQVDTKTRSGSLRTRLDLTAGIFIACNNVSGRFTLKCTSAKNVKIGKITVYLAGYEEVLSSSASSASRRLFFHDTVDLQSARMPPSEAIVPGPCDEHGMWPARQGTTSFDFSIKLTSETSLPSSFWSPKVGGIRYIVSAVVEAKFGFSKPTLLVVHQEAQVVQHVPMFLPPNIVPSLTMWAQDSRIVGWLKSRSGEVSVKARCHTREFDDVNSSSSGAWISGGVGHVLVDVRNESRRKVKTLKLSLVRRLKTFSRTNSDVGTLIPLHFSRLVVAEKTYIAVKPKSNSAPYITRPNPLWTERSEKNVSLFTKDSWSGVKKGESVSLMAEIDIPPLARSIQNGLLIEVSYAIQVSITPRGSQEIKVEIPVTILHPMSLLAPVPTVPTVVSTAAIEVKVEVPVVVESSETLENGRVLTEQLVPVENLVEIERPTPSKSSTRKIPPPPPAPIKIQNQEEHVLDEGQVYLASLLHQQLKSLSPPNRNQPQSEKNVRIQNVARDSVSTITNEELTDQSSY
ncbi:hypothetical protein HDU79_002152 [Rhizoclosmatium sp. JEL0117]|nr:hypothetical protein HDU79_002152 [Rhizoclosmatium sp. JEL0117]